MNKMTKKEKSTQEIVEKLTIALQDNKESKDFSAFTVEFLNENLEDAVNIIEEHLTIYCESLLANDKTKDKQKSKFINDTIEKVWGYMCETLAVNIRYIKGTDMNEFRNSLRKSYLTQIEKIINVEGVKTKLEGLGLMSVCITDEGVDVSEADKHSVYSEILDCVNKSKSFDAITHIRNLTNETIYKYLGDDVEMPKK